MMTSTTSLLSIQNLSIQFPTEAGPATAVNQLSLELQAGKIYGLVGESGCGKSLSSLAILRLIPKPGEITSGSITFRNQDLLALPNEAMRRLRGSEIAIIPQDPLTSLNPVYTIGNQLMEVIELHQGVSKQKARQKAIELLDQVRLPDAKSRIDQYPHEFSGGMRQRVMIAMGLSCSPSLLIADEPTTALDVTVQAQILKLMKELQQEHETTILLITHDLGVVAETCEHVSVMYAGRIVEQGSVRDIFHRPAHPYTEGLLKSIPNPQKIATREKLIPIAGQPPSIKAIPPGCSFEPRCDKRLEVCTTKFPDTIKLDASHQTACYLYSSK